MEFCFCIYSHFFSFSNIYLKTSFLWIIAEGHLFYLAYVQTYVIVNLYHQHNQGLLMSVLVSMVGMLLGILKESCSPSLRDV
jgi:hypothetical protein